MKKKIKLSKIPISNILGALSDPARLDIVKTLIERDGLYCGEFGGRLSKSTMSHHFKVLQEAGFLTRIVQGTKQCNTLRKKEIESRCPGLLEAIAKTRAPY